MNNYTDIIAFYFPLGTTMGTTSMCPKHHAAVALINPWGRVFFQPLLGGEGFIGEGGGFVSEVEAQFNLK